MSRLLRAGLWVALSLATVSSFACGSSAPTNTEQAAAPSAGSEISAPLPSEIAAPAEPAPVANATPEAPPAPTAEIVEVANFGDKLATTTAVSKSGRKFVNFPRWFKDNEPAQQVGELDGNGTVVPFPDASWNAWKEGDKAEKKLVCVQSVVIDQSDRLWILDAGAPYWGKVVKGGPKLVGVDLAHNKVVKTIKFDDKIAAENSYLNDVRIDPNGKFAYISDSNLGRIVVVDLASGKSRIVLDQSPTTKAEEGVVPTVEGIALKLPDGSVFKINVDGIAIAGDYLYYHAVTAKKMYRIKLDVLRDKKKKPDELEAAVEKAAETGVHDGIEGDATGNVYVTQVEENAIRVLKADGTQETVAKDPRFQWPDSIGMGPDGLYVTISQVHLLPVFNGGQSKRTNPYRVFRVTPKGWVAPAAVAASEARAQPEPKAPAEPGPKTRAAIKDAPASAAPAPTGKQ